MGKYSQSNVSKKNPLWIPKNRYYELKYFCLKYWDWQKERAQLDGMASKENREPTEWEGVRKAELEGKIKMVMTCLRLASRDLEEHLLYGVTKGLSYDTLSARKQIPACR